MDPSWVVVAVLAVIQGLAELLPVSSSAHVVVAGHLLGLQMGQPRLTLLLVMLHTGTMVAVILYYWRRWRERFWGEPGLLRQRLPPLIGATVATLVIGFGIKTAIEHLALARHWLAVPPGESHPEFEQLFDNLPLVGGALMAVGVLIVIAGVRERRRSAHRPLTPGDAYAMGIVQGLCLPFRGFSRSGATISTALLRGTARAGAEEVSFALGVLITPAAIAWEALRVWRQLHGPHGVPLTHLGALVATDLVGAGIACIAGLLALRWLSAWLGEGLWYLFGCYCLAAGLAVVVLGVRGF